MQRRKAQHLLYIAITLIIASCRKTEIQAPGVASLTIINAVPEINELVPNFSGTETLPNYYYNAKRILYNTFQPDYQLSAYSGEQRLVLYNYPDTLPKSTPVADLTLSLPVGSISTLFITGTAARPDTLFTADQPPYYLLTDTVMGVRFINLSPGSQPISINIQGEAAGSGISSLPYKGVSEFKRYPATSNISSYTFEFRDQASGKLLAVFLAKDVNNNSSNADDPVNKWRNRNCTLALLGLPDDGSGNSTQTVLLINNY